MPFTVWQINGFMWVGASGPILHLVSIFAAKVWGGISWPDAVNCGSSIDWILAVLNSAKVQLAI